MSHFSFRAFRFFQLSRRLWIGLVLLFSAGLLRAAALTDSQALEIGQRIWKNECGGTVAGLTSWNSGEDFASLGIGHFIWYPEGKRGPYEESFPRLAASLAKQGVKVPGWMGGPCVWTTRREFQAAKDSSRMRELRKLLANTIPQQARFAAQRLEGALPKMLAAAPASGRDRVKKNFQRVAAQALGYYALMDYVNFKGEGVSPSERYRGQGWGLLQVLETMPTTGPALPAFARAADQMLTRRVKNSPSDRNEAQWLPGWRNRLATYTR
jgi:hypothetical protein